MARLLGFDGIFFLLPFAIYAGWLVVTRGHLGTAADWSLRTIGYLAIAGAVVMLLGIIAFIQFDVGDLSSRGSSGSVKSLRYVPAKVENGVVVPGHFEPSK
jgi:hypothetical protein